MRAIDIPLPPHLPSQWAILANGRAAAVLALATHKERSDYIKKHASWNRLKKWLAILSGQKCWYCEAKSPRASFDVDHFRPKLGITVNNEELVGHQGYYWLSFDWSNFRLSCQRCNRPEKDERDTLHGKANEFPIQNEANRCQTPAVPLDAESPRLLDPCSLVDFDLLAHGVDGEVRPASMVGTWEYERADYTIKRLGFNEWNTPEGKRICWQTLVTLIKAIGNTATPEVVAELNNYLGDDHEYSRFFRSAIGTHRDKAWVEALL